MLPNLIICTTVPLLIVLAYRGSYIKGFSLGLFFLIVLSQYIGIKINNTLPVLTAHRIILIVIIYFWLKKKKDFSVWMKFKTVIVLLIATNTISLIHAFYFLPALKTYISFMIEGLFFFIIMITTLHDPDSIEIPLKYCYFGLTVVAALTIIEANTNFKILDILPAHFNLSLDRSANYSTFPHPILLGAAMACGLIISTYYLQKYEGSKTTIIIWINLAIFGTALYYSFSRGAWLAGILGILLLTIFADV